MDQVDSIGVFLEYPILGHIHKKKRARMGPTSQIPSTIQEPFLGDDEPSKHTEKYGFVFEYPVKHTWLVTIVPSCPCSTWHGASMFIMLLWG